MRIHRRSASDPPRSRRSLAACNRGGAPGAGRPSRQGRGGPPPAAGVAIVTLEDKPIELVVGVHLDRCGRSNSTTIQPQVDGRVDEIYVKSGDTVRVGAPLVQIDPEKQAATVRNTESQRAGREADVTYWKARSSGCSRCSRRARSARTSSTPRSTTSRPLRRTSPRSTRRSAKGACSCSTYRVTAPTAGVVGDIADPRRRSHHDARRSSRRSTTRRGSRPTSRCRSIARRTCASASPTQILDADGKVVATNPITFVVAARRSGDADGPGEERSCSETPADMKIQQFVKIRVVWRSVPGPDDSGHRRHAHQRPVFLLRRRAGRRRPGRAPASRPGRRGPRQRLRRHRRPEGGRAADRRRASRRSRDGAPVKAQ